MLALREEPRCGWKINPAETVWLWLTAAPEEELLEQKRLSILLAVYTEQKRQGLESCGLGGGKEQFCYDTTL